jgi:hypothetical protein
MVVGDGRDRSVLFKEEVMDDGLAKRERSMEELFFRERDAKLIEEYKKLEVLKKNISELATISGIKNPVVLQKLVAIGISAGTLSLLSILPLVEVAWADGQLSEKEKEEVLKEAAKCSISKDSVNYSLLEGWLEKRPESSLLEAWILYIKDLKQSLNPQEIDELKVDLLSKAKKVAQATGGLIYKVSPEEKAVISKMEDAFI